MRAIAMKESLFMWTFITLIAAKEMLLDSHRFLTDDVRRSVPLNDEQTLANGGQLPEWVKEWKAKDEARLLREEAKQIGRAHV